MAKHNTGDHGEQIPAIFHPFSVQQDRFFVFFVFDMDFAAERAGVLPAGRTNFHPDRVVLFPGFGHFRVPGTPERGTKGSKVQGLQKISLPLPVFPNQENVISVDTEFIVGQVAKKNGTQGIKNHDPILLKGIRPAGLYQPAPPFFHLFCFLGASEARCEAAASQRASDRAIRFNSSAPSGLPVFPLLSLARTKAYGFRLSKMASVPFLSCGFLFRKNPRNIPHAGIHAFEITAKAVGYAGQVALFFTVPKVVPGTRLR
jgi:hypothetical protein